MSRFERLIAQSSLASMHETDIFGMEDPIEAYAWYALAAPSGEKLAHEGLARLSEQLTPEQIAQGQRRMEDYRAKLAARPVDDAG